MAQTGMLDGSKLVHTCGEEQHAPEDRADTEVRCKEARVFERPLKRHRYQTEASPRREIPDGEDTGTDIGTAT